MLHLELEIEKPQCCECTALKKMHTPSEQEFVLWQEPLNVE